MEDKSENNFAYVDGQNLNAGIEAARWKIDHGKFREYLRSDLGVKKAYIFLGYMEEHQALYNALQEAGFILHFKPLVRHEDSAVKGNVDADLVLQAMIDIERYDKAVIVSGDGDFAGLVRHLASANKLKQVIIPNRDQYSSLFRRLEDYQKYFMFLDTLKPKLTYRSKGGRPQKSQNNRKPVPKTKS